MIVIENRVAVGIVAYHHLNESTAEMKGLFVKKEYRHLGYEKVLAFSIVQKARLSGYSRIVLDTIAPLKSTIRLYKELRFKECTPYYNNSMEDVIYMSLNL